MLVLTRKVGESIRIGDDIEVYVAAIDRNRVRLGIRSPGEIPIHRSEIYDKAQKENREAVTLNQDDLEKICIHVPPREPANTKNHPS